MVGFSSLPLSLAVAALFLGLVAAFLYWASRHLKPLHIHRFAKNPILGPDPTHSWESEAVFNPAAVVYNNQVHLFYRALGHDGISRFGYAKSSDGITFERYPTPAFDRGAGYIPSKKLSYKTLTYNTDTNASGGGWGGTEDPRAVIMDGKMYMTFEVFESWGSLRLAVTSLLGEDLGNRRWDWSPNIMMSPLGETNKNWVLFPEKINGKFAILHALTPAVMIEYRDTLETLDQEPIHSNNKRSGRPGHWDAFIRGAGAPPIRTEHGWLLFYHGMNPDHGAGYNVGAMLLDLADPTKILHQTDEPILSPDAWYENEWKQGVVYASGAVVFNGDLIIYYGGGDKYVAAATGNFDHFVDDLMHDRETKLIPLSYT